MNEKELTVQSGSSHAMQNELTVVDVMLQVKKIQEIMSQAMKKDTHYGIIPGTDKPSLYQPGAQKLALTFRLGFRNRVEPVELERGHREYRSRTTVFHIPSGVELGEVQATCSTMESKYRYRWENTNREVPKEYWDTRDTSLIGGEGFVPRKTWTGEGQARKQVWMVFHRVEHDNPADYYNTCEKMAQKRSEVKGVLNITAASDIFTQDTEDIPQELLNPDGTEAAKDLPACPKCGKRDTVIESKIEWGGGYVCYQKKKGCGHKWGQPEKGQETKPEGNGGPKPGVYPITPTHERLYGLIESECDGDMIRMGDMLATLTKWEDAKGKQIPGKREVGQITVKQAEYAIQHFIEQFGEREPGQEG